MEKWINQEELLTMVSTLVAIPSHYNIQGGEAQVAEALEAMARKEGLKVQKEEITPGRFNIEISLQGGEQGPHILFCGHMDTVRTEGMEIDPYAGYVSDGKLWGRGSVDMKGGLASMLYSIILIKRNKLAFKGKVTLIGTVGEECPNQSEGAYALRKRGQFADMAIIGEATELNIAIAHKGTLSMEVAIKGRAAHSSNPSLGENAIYKAVELIHLITQELLPGLVKRSHPLCETATLNVGMIKGGVQNNIVPDLCTFSLNRRYIPGEAEEDILQEIRDLWGKLPYNKEDMSISVLPETLNRIPMETKVEEPVVGKLLQVTKKLGLHSHIYGANYWTDGAHLGAVGIPTVVFGPGNIREAHGAIEYIQVDQLIKATEVYTTFLLENGQ